MTEDKINSYIEQERRQLLEEHVDSHSVKSHCCGLMTTDNVGVHGVGCDLDAPICHHSSRTVIG